MNVIIPIGGLGKRFSDEGYPFPKPLVRSLGKEIIFWNIENLKLSEEDVVYVIYRREFDKFNFEELVRNRFSDLNFVFIAISNETRGASETVLYALQEMDESVLSKTTIVVDSDNFYDDDVLTVARTSQKNLIFYKNDTESRPIYSYLEVEGNRVVDIREKMKISDLACVGAYCFSDARSLLLTIRSVIVGGEKQNNEFYISSIYRHMIKDGVEVFAHEISGFNCLGTPNQIKAFSSNLSVRGERKRFCFDLDNTLVTYPDVSGDYSTVRPIHRTISFLRFLHRQGHTIIVQTARRMRTHGGNVGRVQADIAKITYDTLERFGIPYDEIHFGKPYAHFYIDDLAARPSEDLEKITGFYNIHPETRIHNRIEVFDSWVCKYSDSLDGEAHFYTNIPEKVSDLFAKPLDIGQGYLKIEKINGIPVSFLNVNGTLSKNVLIGVLEALTLLHGITPANEVDIYANYGAKLRSRIAAYDFSEYKDFERVSSEILEYLDLYEKERRGVPGVIHGDPVFTNVLIDTNDRIKMIDMRGRVGDELTVYGDIFYDYAKVYQSLIGYDHVLMGKDKDISIGENVSAFEEYIVRVYGTERLQDVKVIAKSLLISLIPLHSDEKRHSYYNLVSRIA